MRRRQAGFALLIILWMLALLALIADRMIVVGRAESRIAYNLRIDAAAEAAADGGVFEAIYRLMASSRSAWHVDGRPRHLIVGGEAVVVRLEDESMKINLNSAPRQTIQLLLSEVGTPAATAQSLAQSIVDWRAPIADTERAGRVIADYAAARLPAGPAQAPFVAIPELGGVIGMTPDLVARLSPHLTLVVPGGKNPGRLDPIVAAVLKRTQRAQPSSPTQTSGKPPPTPLQTLTIRAVAVGADSSFERDAIVNIGGPGGYQIISWRDDAE